MSEKRCVICGMKPYDNRDSECGSCQRWAAEILCHLMIRRTAQKIGQEMAEAHRASWAAWPVAHVLGGA